MPGACVRVGKNINIPVGAQRLEESPLLQHNLRPETEQRDGQHCGFKVQMYHNLHVEDAEAERTSTLNKTHQCN